MLRRIARPMLAWVFVSGGIDTLRRPEGRVEAARPKIDKTLGGRELPVPTDAETLVKVNAAVMTGAGLALGLGKAPRLAALVLAGSLLPTTLAGHSFWEHEEPGDRAAQQVQFNKNLGLLGGLLVAAADKGDKRKPKPQD